MCFTLVSPAYEVSEAYGVLTDFLHSTVEIPRPRDHWHHIFPSKHCPLHRQHGDDIFTLLLSPRNIQSIFFTSHGKTLYTGGGSLLRYDPSQHIAVWPRPYW